MSQTEKAAKLAEKYGVSWPEHAGEKLDSIFVDPKYSLFNPDNWTESMKGDANLNADTVDLFIRSKLLDAYKSDTDWIANKNACRYLRNVIKSKRKHRNV